MKKFISILLIASVIWLLCMSVFAESDLEHIEQGENKYVTVQSINARFVELYETGTSDTLYFVLPIVSNKAIFVSCGEKADLLLGNITLYNVNNNLCVSHECFYKDMFETLLGEEREF
jgi:choline-glycine betaine transporter